MTQLYHAANNPQVALNMPRYMGRGGVFVSTDTDYLTLAAANSQDTYIPMSNADGAQGILVPDRGVSRHCVTSVVGLGGLSEAVGNNRAYPVYVVARADGQQWGLIGLRVGEAITDYLPAGYTWYSPPMCPCIVDDSGDLYRFLYHQDGWFSFGPTISVLSSGTETAAVTAIDLTNVPVNNAEIVDTGVRAISWLGTAIGNQAGVETCTLYQRSVVPSWEVRHTWEVSNVAGYARTWRDNFTTPIADPTQSIAYQWSGAPTGGLSLLATDIFY